MKKFIKVFCLLLTLCLTLSIFGCNLGVSEKVPTEDKFFVYEETSQGYIISSLAEEFKEELPSQIILPSTYNGKNVTKIGTSLFAGTAITSISIPSTITEIGLYAFESCTSLKAIEFSEGLQYIRQGAFSKCSGLANTIIFPKTLKAIETRAFEYCNLLSVVDVVSTCTIATDAFGAEVTINKI